MIKELKIEFIGRGEVKGFYFKQLQKNPIGYLYQVNTSFLTQHYEVFERKVFKRFNTIAYPKSGSFGISAWSILNYEDAIKKFNEL